MNESRNNNKIYKINFYAEIKYGGYYQLKKNREQRVENRDRFRLKNDEISFFFKFKYVSALASLLSILKMSSSVKYLEICDSQYISKNNMLKLNLCVELLKSIYL